MKTIAAVKSELWFSSLALKLGFQIDSPLTRKKQYCGEPQITSAQISNQV